MRFSLYFLAATLTTFSMTGYCNAQQLTSKKPYSTGKVAIPIEQQTIPNQRPTIRERIRNFFFPPAEPKQQSPVRINSNQTRPSPYTWRNHTPTTNRPPMAIKGNTRNEPPISFKGKNTQTPIAIPKDLGKGEPVVIQDAKTVETMRPANSLPERVASKVGHEKDYTWITGVLTRIPGFKSQWVVRYAGPFELDKYNGSVMLSRTPDTNQFSDGDLVNVHGRIVPNARGAGPHAGAVYEASDMFLIEKGALRGK